jgi:LacI family transcriptional regulator
MSVTIKEIAQRTGLSVPTVGNVLGRSGSRYSAETRQRVLDAARQMGYRPNSSARAMRQGRFGCAALVLSRSKQQTHSYLPAGLLDGLDNELARHDMHLTITRLSDEELSRDEFVPKVLREHMADGMIVNYTHGIPPGMLELIHAHHTPAVWLNAKLNEDCVYADDFRASESVTEELIRLGHRRIALVRLHGRLGFDGTFEQNKASMHYSVFDRIGGYEAAMRRAGLTPRVLSHERFVEPADHFEASLALLAATDRPTALLLYSEWEVHPVTCAARVLGLSVPRDLSVAVFAPTNVWATGYDVSAAAIPTPDIGRRAVNMLLRKLAAPNESCEPQAVAYGLGDRSTVAAAPTA